MTDYILYEESGGIATITLNRADKLNAFCEPMHVNLREKLQHAAENDAVRCIILTGAGRGFSAGQDLGERLMHETDLGETLETFYAPIIHQIRKAPKPVICAVNGVAAGAAANIALACDFVIAVKSAHFIEAFIKIGLMPDSGGTWFLPRLIGEARAKAMSMLGEPISATQAADWGLIWQAVEDEALDETVQSLAQQFANGPTLAYGLTKQAIQEAMDQSLEAQLELEAKLQRILGNSPDYAEGVEAFNNKRPPKFTGQKK